MLNLICCKPWSGACRTLTRCFIALTGPGARVRKNNKAGDVLLIEVKVGKVDFQPEGIFKTYGAKSKKSR